VGTEPHRFFPPFRLDPVNAQLWRGDQEMRLRRKTFDVLLYLPLGRELLRGTKYEEER
jgi:hypothetical protein